MDHNFNANNFRKSILDLYMKKLYNHILQYGHISKQVEEILTDYARCYCPEWHIFYELLYVMHISKAKFVKAAFFMYERATRLKCETFNVKNLHKIALCYLTTINCLCLAKKEWKEIQKRGAGDSKFNINDIRKEYYFIRGIISVIETSYPEKDACNQPCFYDTLILLSKHGLFNEAFQMCVVFPVPLVTILKALMNHYFTLKRNVSNKDSEEKLGENLWKLIKYFLENCEDSSIHKRGIESILSNNFCVPQWLEILYMKQNFGDLLCLYVCHGCYNKATNLALIYINSLLEASRGEIKMNFNYDAALSDASINVLLKILKAKHDEESIELYMKLNRKLPI